jgi:hypothetical protein
MLGSANTSAAGSALPGRTADLERALGGQGTGIMYVVCGFGLGPLPTDDSIHRRHRPPSAPA